MYYIAGSIRTSTSASPHRSIPMATPQTQLTALMADFLHHLGTAKPSPHTLAAYRRDLDGIAAVLVGHVLGRVEVGELEVADLTREALTAAFSDWAAPRADASVRRAQSTWNQFMTYLVERDLAQLNPMPAIRRPKPPDRGKIRSISTQDLARVFDAARQPDPRARNPWPARDLTVVAVVATTGIRLSELTGLTIGSITGEPGAWFLTVTGKGHRTRTIPTTDQLQTIITGYLSEHLSRFPNHRLDRPTTPLLVHHAGQAITNRQVQYLIEQLFRRAGVSVRHGGALVHALRHTFATDALSHGANIREIQTLLGHASLDTTQTYLRAAPNELRDTITSHPATQLLNTPDRQD